MTQTINILLIEDSQDDADLLLLALRKAKISAFMERVDGSEEFRIAIAKKEWDVIISDVNMPSFGAVAALNILTEEKSATPFIVISGHLDTEEAVELMRAGAEDFVKKDDMARLAPAIERALRDAELVRSRRAAINQIRRLNQAVEQSPIGIVILDNAGNVEYLNAAFSTMCGFEPDAVKGHSFYSLITNNSPNHRTQQIKRALDTGGNWRGEIHSRRANGSAIWLYVTLTPMRNSDGSVDQHMVMLEDITIRKEYEQKLMRQASYDELTKLPNRLLAFDRISLALADSRRNHTRAALFFIDLDNFKNVNDTLGHFAGDALLVEAATRLQACLRESTTLARFGGDEFLVVMPELDSPQNAHVVAQRILKTLQAPFSIQGRELYVTASIGITLYPDDGENTQVLLQNADAAMYRSKDMGRNAYSFFTPEMNQQVSQRLGIETKLRRALENQEFSLVYQPVVTTDEQKLIAVETLIRWHNAELGAVTPDKFIPIAEETGLIVAIGEWVLRESCRQLAHWNRRFGQNIRLAVNVSSRQFLGEGLLPVLESVLEQTSFPPELLELEITERLILSEAGSETSQLTALHDRGIRLSIDDFGTGYSALSYLKKFPFSILKIDRSFVRDITTDKEDASLTRAIIAMAHGLGLHVIAEGVETAEQQQFLAMHRCDMFQGYWFSKPLSPEQFEEQFFLNKNETMKAV